MHEMTAAKPNLYAVVMHDDDFTQMSSAFEVLTRIFHKPAAQAKSLLLRVNKRGNGVAGIYPYDLAVSKRLQAERFADENDFRVRLSIEVSV
jgi:ATP-dependent Clp protease adaptor protein ClpS